MLFYVPVLIHYYVPTALIMTDKSSNIKTLDSELQDDDAKQKYVKTLKRVIYSKIEPSQNLQMS